MLLKIMRKISNLFSNPAMALQKEIFAETQRGYEMNRNNSPEKLILPADYGKGLPERVVEVLLTKMTYHSGQRVLDVGHANAMDCHLKMLDTLGSPKCITGIDIAEPTYDTRKYYCDSIRGDITKTDFSNNSFDLIWCISALEHFGMDNSQYTDNFIRNVELPKQAIEEMFRILAPKGTLLITVPYGKYENHTSHVNCDAVFLDNLLKDVRARGDIKLFYFRHTFGNGWFIASPEELLQVGYYDQANAGSGGLAAILITKP